MIVAFIGCGATGLRREESEVAGVCRPRRGEARLGRKGKGAHRLFTGCNHAGPADIL